LGTGSNYKTISSSQAIVLDTRQQVCLIYYFKGSDLLGFFAKSLTKSLPLENYSKPLPAEY